MNQSAGNELPVDVLLLAAGYGKRLKPLTYNIPKPLVSVAGKPLIEWNLELLRDAGFKKVFVNGFYLADKLRQFLLDGSPWGMQIEFVEESVILDTGGALKNIAPRLTHPNVLVYNSDVLLGRDFPLRAFVQNHILSDDGRLATLSLREDPDFLQYGEVAINAEGRICSFLGENYCQASSKLTSLMFMGLSIWSADVLNLMPAARKVFSITRDILVDLLERGEKIHSFQYDGYFCDVGTISRLERASKEFKG